MESVLNLVMALLGCTVDDAIIDKSCFHGNNNWAAVPATSAESLLNPIMALLADTYDGDIYW